MAFCAKGHSLLFAHNPGMGSMALKTTKSLPHVKSMLSDSHFALMTFLRACSRIRLYSSVRLMALMTSQPGHRTNVSDIAVTLDAPVFRDHRSGFF